MNQPANQQASEQTNEQTDRPTPPKQTPDDPNVADRRLSDEQKRAMKNEPAPPQRDKIEKADMPNPKDVGEAG
ncbi:hypothetical protein AWB79_00908 [Caballeronia hypogeia]|uniref:Uncharacterized protein n=1 Tax=Caballeronia hypogeia TaxID=1777140 RepID=A0A157ZHI7_9BURK|nr:hypothetical protein [Caballeronia hypogeia]SAK44960.1 hypothetical protein AWB79_00908 [Caballeronia hypogeia]